MEKIGDSARMGKYFGTDGIRSQANQGVMAPDFILRLGQAFGIILKRQYKHPKILVGKDTRLSGYMIEGALTAGLCSVGVDVLLAGPLPTPGVAYLTRGIRADGGIMISASHNPYTDNGLKFFDAKGSKLDDDQEKMIENLMDSKELHEHQVLPEFLGKARRIDDAVGQYAVFLKECFSKNNHLEGKKIVIDCAHGAGYKVAPKVFQELGADVIPINHQPSGFNINLNCGAMHPQQLVDAVLFHKADVGFALDGDADRLIIVDEKGSILDGDQIIALCALELKEKNQLKNNGISVTIMSNKGLDVAMERAGIQVERTQVGDRYVLEGLKKRGFVLGGEQSGHLIFLNVASTGDGIVAALQVLEVMVRRQLPLSQIAQVMEKYPQVTRSVKVFHKPPLHTLSKTRALIQNIEHDLGQNGRVLVRYSGTESLVRITLEGPCLESLEKMLDDIARNLVEEIGAPFKN